MYSINPLPFSQLKNAEHVSFFNNVVLAIQKIGAEDIGLTTEQFARFKQIVDDEQDIVLNAQGSMYTDDMKAIDNERDQIFRMIHHKLQAVLYVSSSSPLYPLKASLTKYILNKYDTDIVSLPYHEESAHLSGFILDMRSHFTEEDLEAMGIGDDLVQLKVTNNRFSDMYNERATERSGGLAEMSKVLRGESEDNYGLIKLHIEFTANIAGETEQGETCISLIGVINEIVRDAHLRLNQRLGRSTSSSSSGENSDLDANVSPIPYPKN